MVGKKVSTYLRMIKFSHSIFALPFAFTGALIAAEGIPSFSDICWITVAMVSARSGAMGMNRVIDRHIDALNPRTSNRELPRGIMKTRDAIIFTLASLALFFLAAYKLNPLCVKFYPLTVAILFIYSYTKRFTWLSHLVLGISLALAPLGAWVAIRGTLNPEMLPLSLAVIFWVSGFDILYALQDLEFDKNYGLYSIPVKFGVPASLWLARLLHVLTIALLFSLVFLFPVSYIYLIGVFISLSLLIYEHMLVKPNDLRRLNMAFFNMNGYISVTVFVFTLLSYLT
jgi:4-hydroxybenzoate polyprenyltransferase